MLLFIRILNFPFLFKGNGHIIFNGSFFYDAGLGRVGRLDLFGGEQILNRLGQKFLTLPEAAVDPARALYSTAYTYMDFGADDNGLWVIYAMNNSNNTAVIKVSSININ